VRVSTRPGSTLLIRTHDSGGIAVVPPRVACTELIPLEVGHAGQVPRSHIRMEVKRGNIFRHVGASASGLSADEALA